MGSSSIRPGRIASWFSSSYSATSRIVLNNGPDQPGHCVSFRVAQVCLFILAVHREQEYRQPLVMEKVNHPRASSFSATRPCPPQLSDATGFGNQIADFRV